MVIAIYAILQCRGVVASLKASYHATGLSSSSSRNGRMDNDIPVLKRPAFRGRIGKSHGHLAEALAQLDITQSIQESGM